MFMTLAITITTIIITVVIIIATTATSSRRARAADDLEEGTTTLMLRRLPLEMTASSLVVLLNAVAPKEFDFETNIALAFINFIEAASALKTFRYFRSLRPTPEWNVGVSAGNVQGNAPTARFMCIRMNLAYFAARFGVRALFSPSTPLLFNDGIQLFEIKDRQFEVEEFGDHTLSFGFSCLPPSLMKEARLLLKAERGSARRYAGRTRRARTLVWKPGVPFTLPESETVATASNEAAQPWVDTSGSENQNPGCAFSGVCPNLHAFASELRVAGIEDAALDAQ
eukprot:s900_g2.t1